jgi:hypothetical protein
MKALRVGMCVRHGCTRERKGNRVEKACTYLDKERSKGSALGADMFISLVAVRGPLA